MSKLYIIGNGFDLFNGLNTSYADFHKFVILNYPELETTIENYFSFETNHEYLWKNFENDLGTFDHSLFFEDINNIDVRSDSFSPSEAFGLEDDIIMEVDNLIEELKDAFTEWITSIEFPSAKNNKLHFEEGARFINFNYTDTLEVLYCIPKSSILYIHNHPDQGELIFGHGKSEEDNPAENELDQEGNSNRTIFTDSESAARYPFYALMKKTAEIMDSNREHFKKLKKTSEILVLGQSLGMADWPYFKRIQDMLPAADWKISYYSAFEKEALRNICITELKIPEDKIEMIKMEQLRE